MKLTGICLITNDVPRLADFYSTLLGVETEGDSTHMEVHTPGAQMTIFSVEGMEGMAPGSMQVAGHGSAIISFEVDDIHAEYAKLQRLGMPFVKPLLKHPWGAASFWFRDPDGNIVDFYTKLEG